MGTGGSNGAHRRYWSRATNPLPGARSLTSFAGLGSEHFARAETSQMWVSCHESQNVDARKPFTIRDLTPDLLTTSVRAAMGDVFAAAVLIELIKMTTVLTVSAGSSARWRAHGLGKHGSLLRTVRRNHQPRTNRCVDLSQRDRCKVQLGRRRGANVEKNNSQSGDRCCENLLVHRCPEKLIAMSRSYKAFKWAQR